MTESLSIHIEVFVGRSPEHGIDLLRAATENRRPSLIVVDPLLRFVRLRDSNDYAEVTHALEPLLALARETGAHVLVVHHTGKGERADGDAIIGSTAFFAAVDTALLLKRSERYRTLSTIQRYGEDLPETILTLDPITRTVTAGPLRTEADEAEAGQAIREYLRGQAAPVEELTIDEGVEGRRQVKVRALRRLVDQGLVI